MEEQYELQEERIIAQLRKHLDQGDKMESLVNSDEWKFFATFLEKAYAKAAKHIMEPNFELSGQRQEDFSRGFAKAIRIFLDTPAEFVAKKERADKELVKREKAKESNDEPTA